MLDRYGDPVGSSLITLFNGVIFNFNIEAWSSKASKSHIQFLSRDLSADIPKKSSSMVYLKHLLLRNSKHYGSLTSSELIDR